MTESKSKSKYISLRWERSDYQVIESFTKELEKERVGRVYKNMAVLEAVQFYQKYRKLVQGS